MKTKCAYGVLLAAMLAGPIHAEELVCSEAQGPDQISALDFETFEPGTSLVGESIVLDGEVTVNGSIVTGGNVEATGMVCGAAGCVGDPVPVAIEEALITYDLPAGTSGGSAAVSDAWVTRDLNTVVYDLGDIVVALSGDQILLNPGTYLISANQVFYSANSSLHSVRGRIRDVTNKRTVAVSLNGRQNSNPSTGSAHARAEVPPSVFEVEELTGFELQYFIQIPSSSSSGLGSPMDSGEVERYAYVHIRRISQ